MFVSALILSAAIVVPSSDELPPAPNLRTKPQSPAYPVEAELNSPAAVVLGVAITNEGKVERVNVLWESL